MRSRWIAVGAIVVLAGATLVGCSSQPSTSGEKVTLSYWGWGANTDKPVKEWNKTHPNIQMKYTEAGGGDESSAKLLTASRAGNAPDLALVEYTTLPAMIVGGVPLDITDLVKDVKSKYASGTWAQTTFDGVVYALPQDVGPMAFIYRQDKFDQFGVPAPKTWQDFKLAAETVHAKDPGTVIASLPASELGFYAGVATQAGAKWWSVKDGKWTIGIADDASLKVADFFDALAKQGAISTDPLLTPEYNKKLNEGTMLSWPSALWAPGVIGGVAPDTAGKWAMAPFPEWTAGDPRVAYQGGSGVIITKNSKHPKEAAEFAKWLNASDSGAKLLVSQEDLYPAAIFGQKYAESNKPPALMPQQTDYYTIAAKISATTIPVTWGPDVNFAKTQFTDLLNKAIANGTPWRDAFIATQAAVVKDMKTTGYKVTNK